MMGRWRGLLAGILALYLILMMGYALLTPLWQAPDEPAHFNNIVTLAQTGRLPVLQPGDYDQARLEALKAAGFPPDQSIAGIRYEGHQPPLYYILMTPLYLLLAGAPLHWQVWALRLANGLIGLGTLGVMALAWRRLFPNRPRLGVLAVGFAAFLPMHIAMNASVNNDALAELMIAVTMFLLLGMLGQEEVRPRQWALVGAIIGLALLTKFQTYFLAPLAVGVWLWRAWRMSRRGMWRKGLALVVPMMALPLPWWIRNMLVYGPTDPLGLLRHDQVVVGQPRTLDWIASQGLEAYLHRLVMFTFQSFWGVFGWMGVFMDARIYTCLGLLSLLMLVGAGYQAWRWRKGELSLTREQRRGLALLGVQLLAVVLAYGWYNWTFVQHQGRYLFPALLPISGLAAGGLYSPPAASPLMGNSAGKRYRP